MLPLFSFICLYLGQLTRKLRLAFAPSLLGPPENTLDKISVFPSNAVKIN